MSWERRPSKGTLLFLPGQRLLAYPLCRAHFKWVTEQHPSSIFCLQSFIVLSSGQQATAPKLLNNL